MDTNELIERLRKDLKDPDFFAFDLPVYMEYEDYPQFLEVMQMALGQIPREPYYARSPDDVDSSLYSGTKYSKGG